MQTKKKKRRGIYFDVAVLKTYLKNMNITRLSAFDKAYQAFFQYQLKGILTAPKNAWRGDPMDRQGADAIATFLGLQGYEALLAREFSAWQQLMTQKSQHARWFELVEYESSDALHMVILGKKSIDGLRKVNLDAWWNIKIMGEDGDEVLIILQSDSSFFVMAPAIVHGDRLPNKFTADTLFYPSHPVPFEKAQQPGWRRLVIIKTEQLMFATKDDEVTTLYVSFDELDIFARRLYDSKLLYQVATLEFDLTDD